MKLSLLLSVIILTACGNDESQKTESRPEHYSDHKYMALPEDHSERLPSSVSLADPNNSECSFKIQSAEIDSSSIDGHDFVEIEGGTPGLRTFASEVGEITRWYSYSAQGVTVGINCY